MSSKIPANLILKQQNSTSKSTVSDEQKAKVERDRRNLGIALYHANKIQSQKDITSRILSNIEILASFPAAEECSNAEARRFPRLIEIFQPFDFDELIEERRTDKRCGYVLCSTPSRSSSLGASASWRLESERAGDFCSNVCLQKALYVRTQLSETPAWEREPGQQPVILLHEDDRLSSKTSSSLSRAVKDTPSRLQVADARELAMERGETTQSLRSKQVMTDIVVEKDLLSTKPCETTDAVVSHRAVEGYEPKPRDRKVKPSATGDDDDEEAEDISQQVTNSDTNSIYVKDKDEEESWQELFKSIDRREMS